MFVAVSTPRSRVLDRLELRRRTAGVTGGPSGPPLPPACWWRI